MAPMKAMKAMKAMKGGKSITKGGLADAISAETEVKKSDCSKVLTALAEVVAKEVKKTGKVIVPGIARIVTRTKKATKAGKREMCQGPWGEDTLAVENRGTDDAGQHDLPNHVLHLGGRCGQGPWGEDTLAVQSRGAGQTEITKDQYRDQYGMVEHEHHDGLCGQ